MTHIDSFLERPTNPATIPRHTTTSFMVILQLAILQHGTQCTSDIDNSVDNGQTREKQLFTVTRDIWWVICFCIFFIENTAFSSELYFDCLLPVTHLPTIIRI